MISCVSVQSLLHDMACHQMTCDILLMCRMDTAIGVEECDLHALLLQLRCISPSFFVSRTLFHMCDMTLSYVWHDSFICVTWLFHMCDMTLSYVWHDSFICVTWLFHMCDMTHLPESLMRDLRLVLCGIIHSHVWHVSFPCVTWLIPMCDMTLSYVWHDSFIYVKWLIHMCDVLHSYVWHHSAHAARAQKYLYSYTRVSVYTHTYIEHSLQRNRCRFRTTLPLEDPTPPHLPKIASSPQAMVCTRVNRGTPNLRDFLAPFFCLFYRPISFNPLHNSVYILYITHT